MAASRCTISSKDSPSLRGSRTGTAGNRRDGTCTAETAAGGEGAATGASVSDRRRVTAGQAQSAAAAAVPVPSAFSHGKAWASHVIFPAAARAEPASWLAMESTPAPPTTEAALA